MKPLISPLKTMAAVSCAAAMFAPHSARACACGCNMFDVGTSSVLPEGPGGMVFLELTYQNQYKNWSGNNSAPAANNNDKEIRTLYVNSGFEYFFNRSWGFQVQVPYDFRTFKTVTADPNVPDGTVTALHWNDIGDIRLKGLYTGFAHDMSSGIDFGVKLPTGNFTHNDAYGDIDRDTELGTGSTDLLLGGFYRHHLGQHNQWTIFGQTELDLPVLTQDGYRPGLESDTSAGFYYAGWSWGRLNITPVGQAIFAERTSDSGPNAANPVASGYQRLLLSPGIEFDVHPFTFYADVELPVFQHVIGNQLVAPAIFKLVFTYHF